MNKNPKIENVEVPWETGVVMICTKCGKGTSFEEAPERIKSELKAKVKSELGKSVRVITTSCLDICPADKIAIVVANTKDPTFFKAYAVDPDSEGNEIYKLASV